MEIAKNPNGRPTKYKREYDEQVYKLCLLNATDIEIAKFFDVAESTIYEWRLKHRKFSESMHEGKIKADTKVAHSLFQRAMGAKCVQQKAIKIKEPIFNKDNKKIGEKESVVVVDVLFEEPPDTAAIKFWLGNRHPDKWKEKQTPDSSTNEELFKHFVNGVLGSQDDD